MKELEDKSYMFSENTLITEETGLKTTRFVFDLQKLGQALLYKLKEHEDNINDLYEKDYAKNKRIATLEKEVEQLKRELRYKDAKEVSYTKEYNF